MNFQNIPRQEKSVKKAILPKLDAFLFFDYKQIEYRVLAFYLAAELGDTTWADNFKAGMDAHTSTAIEVFGYEPPLTDAERQDGKTCNFSMIYLGGIPTIMRQTGRSAPEAKKVVQMMRDKMPGVAEIQQRIRERVEERGYIVSLAGRHLHPKEGERDPSRLLFAALIQGGAAEIMRNGLRNIHMGLRDGDFRSHLVNVVHDEAMLDCDRDEIPKLVELVPHWMDDPIVSEYVPVETDCEVSYTTWADKQKYEG